MLMDKTESKTITNFKRMRRFTTLFYLFLFKLLPAQTPEDAVNGFFEAFHNKDSILLQSYFHPKATLQSTGVDGAGKTYLRSLSVNRFITAVSTRPDQPVWREVLGEMEVQIDFPLAVVWVPYTFYLDDKTLHSGVNYFQWLNESGSWQLIHLIDTRHPKPAKKSK